MKVFRSVQLRWCLLSVAGKASTNTTAQARDDSCPPWQLRSNSTGVCSCDTRTLNSVIICDATPYELFLQECYCITYGQDILAVGPCEYTCQRAGKRGFYFNATVTSTSLINNYICGAYRRTRQMCGGCMSGYAPPVYSYSPTCVNCTTSNLGKYTAVSFLPLTAFFIFVATFRISAFSPKLHGFILFSQILTCPSNMRCLERARSKFTPVQKVLAKAFASFLDIWNLDFFRSVYSPFCLNPHTDTLHVMALDYLIAIYPLLLISLTREMWPSLAASTCPMPVWPSSFSSPSHCCQWPSCSSTPAPVSRSVSTAQASPASHYTSSWTPSRDTSRMALGSFVISQHFTFYTEVQCMPSQCWPHL